MSSSRESTTELGGAGGGGVAEIGRLQQSAEEATARLFGEAMRETRGEAR